MKVEETVTYQLIQILKLHRNQFSKQLSRLGLYVGQEMLLFQLWKEDGLTLSELVSGLGVEPATITKMVGRMEKVGLVTKKRSIEDTRVCHVYLTKQGRSIV